MNSLMSFLNSVSTLAHQGAPTYSTVWRPFLQSMGGSGYLQHAQILNNLITDSTGEHPFEAERRVTNKINVNNYLRAAGRTAGVDVRISRGAHSIPTPAKPWIGEMVMAAYANDMAGFMDAYRKAVDAEPDKTHEERMKHVATAYMDNHPFRIVFNTLPSEHDYRNILAALNPDGQADVTEALRLFDSFGSRIGVKPFAPKSATKGTDIRARMLKELGITPTTGRRNDQDVGRLQERAIKQLLAF
jgi:hypothetical protein